MHRAICSLFSLLNLISLETRIARSTATQALSQVSTYRKSFRRGSIDAQPPRRTERRIDTLI
jgi:hypothetical protein